VTESIWQYLSMVYTHATKTVSLKLNNVDVGSVVLPLADISAWDDGGGTDFALGASSYGASPLFNLQGAVDVPALYHKALSAAEQDIAYNWWLSESGVEIGAYTEVADTGTASHILTLENLPAINSTGQVAEAIALNGIDQYLSLVEHADFKAANVTIALWMRTSALNGTISQCAAQSTGVHGWRLYMAAGKPVFKVGAGLALVTPGTDFQSAEAYTDISDGIYHHVTATYDGSVVKVYVDGILEGAGIFDVAIDYTGTMFTAIGHRNDAGSPSEHLDAVVDDVKYFNRALTAGEIRAIYDTDADVNEVIIVLPAEDGLTLVSSDYVARWDLETLATLDSSIGAHHGTAVGTPSITTNGGRLGDTNSLVLDGVGDHVTVPYSDSLKSTEVTTFVRFKTNGTVTELVYLFGNRVLESAELLPYGHYCGIDSNGLPWLQ